ncbi:hypothetical protein RIF29_27392 [Crotalaria pallida]|uniref:Uncharacterized protein n=1 Tax=Crotalaria pallida TaxID=3830 RepID=A0AAN9EPX3_CROPI
MGSVVQNDNNDQNQPLLSSNHDHHPHELESILSNTTLPLLSRLAQALWVELKLLFFLAAPAVVVYLINCLMFMSTQIFSGHLGTLELAASSLGNTGIQMFAYGLMSERCKSTWQGFTWQAFSGLPEFFKLSAASAVMMCLEIWYFQILVLLAGLLLNPEIALDSLSIWFEPLTCDTIRKEASATGLQGPISTIIEWVFMVSSGFNAAARLDARSSLHVRVSNELGARNPKSASYSAVVVTLISFIISIVEALVVLALKDIISYAFTESEEVAAAVSDLCPLLALSIVPYGIQPVLSGVAVGCGWQTFVAYVNVGCYYGVGIPLGALLGFYFNFGVKGIWLGMLGGTVMQTIILMWVTFRTDWNKEVEEATKRLNKWED